MPERLIRLLRIIILIQTRPGIKAKELAETCETQERTIYRDLELLHAAHIPIAHLGHGQGYEFIGHFSMYPIDWTEAEALAFSMLPNILKQVHHLVPTDFHSAFEKIMGTYDKEKRDRLQYLKELVNVIQMGTPAVQHETVNFLTPVITAILESRQLEVIYHTQSRNVTTRRRMNPYCFIPRNHQFYLIAYCHQHAEIRTFRMSRFQQVTVLEQVFQKQELDLENFLKHTWSIIPGDDYIHFKVLFSEKVARYIMEEQLFVQPKLTPYEDGRLLFEVTLNDDLEFLQWLKQYGADAEIIAPVSYRQKMQEELTVWLEKYKRS